MKQPIKKILNPYEKGYELGTRNYCTHWGISMQKAGKEFLYAGEDLNEFVRGYREATQPEQLSEGDWLRKHRYH